MGKVQSEQVEMTIQDALKKYEKLPTQKRCEVLSEAIDYMHNIMEEQSDNGLL